MNLHGHQEHPSHHGGCCGLHGDGLGANRQKPAPVSAPDAARAAVAGISVVILLAGVVFALSIAASYGVAWWLIGLLTISAVAVIAFMARRARRGASAGHRSDHHAASGL